MLLLPRTAGTGLGGLLHAASGEDFKGGNFPWILVAMVAIVALVGGMAIVWWESDVPMRRMRDETGRLAAGELPRLDDRAFRGRFAQVVRAVNATLDRLVRSGGVVGVTTLSAPERPMPEPIAREPLRPPHSEMPLPAEYEPMMIAGQAAPLAEAKVAAPPMPKLPGQGSGLPSFPLGADEDDGTTQAEMAQAVPSARAAAPRSSLPALPQLDAIPLDAKEAPASAKMRPPARPGQPPATPRAPVSPIATPMPVGMGRAAAPPSPPAPKPAPAPAREAKSPASAPRRPTPFGMSIEELDVAPSSGLKTTAAAGAPDGIPVAPLPPPPAADFGDETVVSQPSDELIDQSRNTGVKANLEAYFRRVYTDFVELKRKCGEPTENVTFEKFVAKLRDNREQLIKKLGCKSVKFQVYVKDGRAALKATPVRE